VRQWRTAEGERVRARGARGLLIAARRRLGMHACYSGSQCGRGVAQGRCVTCGWPRPMAARGWRCVASAHATHSTVQGAHKCIEPELGISARTNGRRPASAFVYGEYGGRPTWLGATSRACSCSRANHFNVTLFDCWFLKILQLKCSKQCIPKLYISLPSTTSRKAL
jgi:hypothetical protein